MIRAALGLLVGLFARLWTATLRYEVICHPSLQSVDPRTPWVLALWHGQLFALLGHRRRHGTVALVSSSNDGELLSWAMRWFRVTSARGSSSRRASAGLVAMARSIGPGRDAAFAVDGPRGPAKVAKVGALATAWISGAVVVPYVAACQRGRQLTSWDAQHVPLPWSRVVVVLGAPIRLDRRPGAPDLDLLEQSLTRCETLAHHALGAGGQSNFNESEEWAG